MAKELPELFEQPTRERRDGGYQGGGRGRGQRDEGGYRGQGGGYAGRSNQGGGGYQGQGGGNRGGGQGGGQGRWSRDRNEGGNSQPRREDFADREFVNNR